ncbi:alpha-ribazole phosphatase [Dyadobacter tibetensis]|uniref:alpha-ribazole phosphatase n=1 Tax=Dyadobacter tibetensis TaxID=1211851 RepID=UPI0004721DB6|nr:alpha-ribazole phosphatase [Dyadobacter tibetensis]
MEIYLIRHTLPKLTPGLIYGHLDIPLAEGYAEEFDRIKALLPERLQTVYSSPSTRCRQLAEHLDPHYRIDERLRELHFGDWEGQTWDSVDQVKLKIWMDDFVNEPVPGGEHLLDLQKRVLQFWKELQLLETQNSIAIITHAGVIRLLLAMERQVALKDMFSISVGYGEVVMVEGSDYNQRN